MEGLYRRMSSEFCRLFFCREKSLKFSQVPRSMLAIFSIPKLYMYRDELTTYYYIDGGAGIFSKSHSLCIEEGIGIFLNFMQIRIFPSSREYVRRVAPHFARCLAHGVYKDESLTPKAYIERRACSIYLYVEGRALREIGQNFTKSQSIHREEK